MSTARDTNPQIGSQGTVIVRQDDGIAPIEYRLSQKLGDGTFGVVWKAVKKERGRPDVAVALKILKATASSEEADREIKSLEALKVLSHPLLLTTHGYWMDADRLVIELELADGGSLKERLKLCRKAGMKGVPVGELLKYFREASWALDYLHTRQPQIFLHRDIKPANILLVKGRAKLADFGLLRQVAGDKSHTHTTGGTEPYMAPESIVGTQTSPRTDLFALAVSYVQLRQGSLPFRGDLSFAIMKKIVDEAPELSEEIFGKAEMAVVLKALEKLPANRHKTCGDFVTALIEAVPAKEAEFVPPEAPPLPLVAPDSETADAAGAGTIKPLDRKKTDHQIRIPDLSGTVRRLPTGDTGVKKPSVTEATDVSMPSTRRRRKKSNRKKLVALFLGMLLLGAGMGVWFHLHEYERQNIETLVKDQKYTEALELIAAAPKWVMPFPDTQIEHVRKEWWNELNKNPGRGKEGLKKQLEELKQFELAFRDHPGLAARRNEIDQAIKGEPIVRPIAGKNPAETSQAVVASFLNFLREGNLPAATRLTIEQGASLLPADKAIVENKLAQKKEVDDALKLADDALLDKRYVDALKALESAKRPEFDADIKRWDGFLVKAKSSEHERLVQVAETALTKLKKSDLEQAKTNLKAFRAKYSDAPTEPKLDKYVIDANAIVDLAWTALLKSNYADCQNYLKELNAEFAMDSAAKSNVHLLTAFVDAHGDKAKLDTAAKAVVEAIAMEKSQAALRSQKLWTALEKLEQEKSLFYFEHADALVAHVPTKFPEQSRCLAHVLRRLVNSDTCWCAHDAKQWDRCREICGLIHDDDKNIWIRCLHAESSVKSQPDAALSESLLKTVDNSNLWYAGYVAALAREKSDAKTAASKLAVVLENNQGKLKEHKERSDTGLAILRQGLGLLREKGKREFADARDARNAKKLLMPIAGLETSERQNLNDLVDLALACGKIRDNETLHEAAKKAAGKLSAVKEAPEKEESYYWLARAYRTADVDGDQAQSVFQYSDQTLAVNKTGRSAWRQLAAEDGAEYAKRRSSMRQQIGATEKDLEDSMSHAETCRRFARDLKPMSVQKAAKLNREGFELLFVASLKLTPGRKEKANAHYMNALETQCEEFHVPLVAFKLGQVISMDYSAEDNEYLKKAVAEARLAKSIAEAAMKAAASDQERLEWWKATHKDLCRKMYNSLAWYTRLRHLKIHSEDPDKAFDKTYIPRLQALLDYALDARNAGAPGDNEEARITFRIGKLYYDLGASNGYAAAYHQKSLDELKKDVMKKVSAKDIVDVDRVVEGRNELQALIYYNEKILEKK